MSPKNFHSHFDPGGGSTISGFPFEDTNLNGFRDSLIVGNEPGVVYVIDTSGSTSDPFGGDAVGDLNNDGTPDTIMDAEISGYEALTNRLIALGFGDVADVSIVSYSTGATRLTPIPFNES